MMEPAVAVKKKAKKTWRLVVFMLMAMIFVPVYRTLLSGDGVSSIVPNFLLFTPYRELAKKLWTERIIVDMNVKREPLQIASIEAKGFVCVCVFIFVFMFYDVLK